MEDQIREQERLRQLEEENQKLKEENDQLKEKNLKDHIYDNIHISVKVLDVFIAFMCVVFVVVLILGLMNR